MAQMTVQAQYLEKPLDEHERTIEINRLAQLMKIAKQVDISFDNTPEPRTTVLFNTSVFTNGAVKKIVPAFLDFFQHISSDLNFSRKEKRISVLPSKDWIIKTLAPSVREYYRTRDNDRIYSVFEDTPGNFVLCRVIEKVNYYKELVGPNVNRLNQCFRRRDEHVLQKVDDRELEMLRLIAPVRDVDKDTYFMSQVATLTGIIGDEHEGGNEELLAVRDILVERGWIKKIEDNYEVTQKFRSINCFSVDELI